MSRIVSRRGALRETVVLFTVGEGRFAIAASAVQEVCGLEGLVALAPAQRSRSVRHMLQRRDGTRLVVDARLYFGVSGACQRLLLQSLHFLRPQQPISPPRQSLYRQCPQANPHQLLHRMHLLHQQPPQLILLRIPHPHFVPKIRRPPARSVRLPHRFHLQPSFLSDPVQIRQSQHPLHLDVIHLFQLGPLV